MNESGTIRVPAFDLPLSDTIDPSVHPILLHREEQRKERRQKPPPARSDVEAMRSWREARAREYLVPLSAVFQERYDVEITPTTIAGVGAEIIVPRTAAPGSRRRVLMNFHGGGFLHGALWAGRVESIPVAALTRCRVVSVDYRLAPEHRFPAATVDAVAVYRKLIEDHEPGTIGIFGCSAGALLAAQTVARLVTDGLPLPGAVGMFCGAAGWYAEGDSGRFAAALVGGSHSPAGAHPYFAGVDLSDPLVFPVRDEAVMSRFPPALLVSATRDTALSSVAHTHSRLVALGVPADLHVWDGLDHAFFYDPDLPQSREFFGTVARFFDRTLGGG